MKQQREITIRGMLFVCNPLTPSMDAAFDNLFARFLDDGIVDLKGEFENAAFRFFDDPATDVRGQTWFFENLSCIATRLNNRHGLLRVEEFWQGAVELANLWESRNGRRLHKGTPYYFWGRLALERGDLDHGYALIHKSLEDDVHFNKGAFPDLPALALVTLNAAKVDQGLRDWVAETAKVLEESLESYRKSYSRTLTYADLHRQFLQRVEVIEPVFIFGYTVARFHRLQKTPSYVRDSDFGAQLLLNLLFALEIVTYIGISESPCAFHLLDPSHDGYPRNHLLFR